MPTRPLGSVFGNFGRHNFGFVYGRIEDIFFVELNQYWQATIRTIRVKILIFLYRARGARRIVFFPELAEVKIRSVSFDMVPMVVATFVSIIGYAWRNSQHNDEIMMLVGVVSKD